MSTPASLSACAAILDVPVLDTSAGTRFRTKRKALPDPCRQPGQEGVELTRGI